MGVLVHGYEDMLNIARWTSEQIWRKYLQLLEDKPQKTCPAGCKQAEEDEPTQRAHCVLPLRDYSSERQRRRVISEKIDQTFGIA